jgi:chemotaxis protein methyltransferase CheR
MPDVSRQGETGIGDIHPITTTEFENIRRFAYERLGIDLRPGKEQLVAARLSGKLRQLKITTFGEYYRRVMRDPDGAISIAMMDALTTNHTSFFREPAHFAFLRETVLPALRARRQVSLWSAACATGEEAYSLGMLLLDEVGARVPNQVRILATDISRQALQTAAEGIYTAEKLDAVPPDALRRHFLRGSGKWQGSYRVRPELRQMIEFRRLNLVESLPKMSFPIVFCRNVMIYFDKPTQGEVTGRLAACLEPGSYLFIGHSESLTGIPHGLEYVRPAVYRNGKACRQKPRSEATR